MTSVAAPAAWNISHEVAIVWVEGEDTVMERYDYVRWMFEKTRNKVGLPRGAMRAGRIIGYADLDDEAQTTELSGRHRRRVFYVKDNDRSEPNGQYHDAAPHEAVDPRTVTPRVYGRLTDRARGRRSARPTAPPPRSACASCDHQEDTLF
ncbi:DUF6009 family protein [Streptomyces sp. NPDC057910]|uniref:DUF6009 family protein n=1 Tax=Streptomyces sp. NPDC057910 TaxID=3346278 RepID=UPI0036E71B66